jgi:putative cell wall-binding protein
LASVIGSHDLILTDVANPAVVNSVTDVSSFELLSQRNIIPFTLSESSQKLPWKKDMLIWKPNSGMTQERFLSLGELSLSIRTVRAYHA